MRHLWFLIEDRKFLIESLLFLILLIAPTIASKLLISCNFTHVKLNCQALR
jgi:hypothetical protein